MAGGTAALIVAPFVIRSSFAQSPAVNIGVIQPLSGANAQFGVNCRNGIELVADAINAAGGIKALGGAKINLIVSDATSTDHGASCRSTSDHPERTHCGPRRIRIVVDTGDFRGDGASRYSLSHTGIR
jgi:Periplasmic binding protein